MCFRNAKFQLKVRKADNWINITFLDEHIQFPQEKCFIFVKFYWNLFLQNCDPPHTFLSSKVFMEVARKTLGCRQLPSTPISSSHRKKKKDTHKSHRASSNNKLEVLSKSGKTQKLACNKGERKRYRPGFEGDTPGLRLTPAVATPSRRSNALASPRSQLDSCMLCIHTKSSPDPTPSPNASDVGPHASHDGVNLPQMDIDTTEMDVAHNIVEDNTSSLTFGPLAPVEKFDTSTGWNIPPKPSSPSPQITIDAVAPVSFAGSLFQGSVTLPQLQTAVIHLSGVTPTDLLTHLEELGSPQTLDIPPQQDLLSPNPSLLADIGLEGRCLDLDPSCHPTPSLTGEMVLQAQPLDLNKSTVFEPLSAEFTLQPNTAVLNGLIALADACPHDLQAEPHKKPILPMNPPIWAEVIWLFANLV
ncbi:hypothetical protein H0H81_006716 [Sphagnurus paluster]|uniref:Uncharacterized protein n=1 Tax=Sphagnurus paluster TaxID=117069 RepID=A0A9P7G1L8_9AGAR|nr:hypothetical protein H0H81_006716 [Sphagnurus paluster]